MMREMAVEADQAREILAQHWDVPLGRVLVSDATSTFAWLRSSRIFVGSRGLGPRAFACEVAGRWFVVPAGSPRTSELACGAASAVLAAESPFLVDALQPTELADALHNLIAGPGAVIASRELLAGVDPSGAAEADPAKLEPIDVWTRGGSRAARAQFRQLCQSPSLVRDADTWSLRFGAFTSNGAFERWVVDGTRAHVHAARMSEPCAPGTFRFPYG